MLRTWGLRLKQALLRKPCPFGNRRVCSTVCRVETVSLYVLTLGREGGRSCPEYDKSSGYMEVSSQEFSDTMGGGLSRIN